MIAFKVVRKRGDKLVSAVINNKDICVEYVPGVRVYPRYRYSMLFVFKSLEVAIRFKRDNDIRYGSIWACDVGKTEECIDRAPWADLINEPSGYREFEYFWRPERHLISFPYFYTSTLPSQTMMAHSVKLIERVTKHNEKKWMEYGR